MAGLPRTGRVIKREDARVATMLAARLHKVGEPMNCALDGSQFRDGGFTDLVIIP